MIVIVDTNIAFSAILNTKGMKIILSETATTDYWQNIDYLLNKWGDKVAVDFFG